MGFQNTEGFNNENQKVPSLLLKNVNTQIADSGINFWSFSGSDPESSVEINAENNFPVPVTIQNITITVTSQTNAINTLRTRKNGVDGNSVINIPASTTGTFRDTVNSDDYEDTDLGNYETETSGAGTLTVGSLGCEVVRQ